MRTHLLTFILLLGLGYLSSCKTSPPANKYAEVSITPKPFQLDRTSLPTYITNKTVIVFDENSNGLATAASQFNTFLKKHFLFKLPINKTPTSNTIKLTIRHLSNRPEEYQLSTTPKGITISANHTAGILHGIQSLKQLIYPAQKATNGTIKVPGVCITDFPKYTWRGMHLDVSRHFYDKKELMKIMDAMAIAKMNIFHWHLTDDQGWRIEIKKRDDFPKERTTPDETQLFSGKIRKKPAA